MSHFQVKNNISLDQPLTASEVTEVNFAKFDLIKVTEVRCFLFELIQPKVEWPPTASEVPEVT